MLLSLLSSLKLFALTDEEIDNILKLKYRGNKNLTSLLLGGLNLTTEDLQKIIHNLTNVERKQITSLVLNSNKLKQLPPEINLLVSLKTIPLFDNPLLESVSELKNPKVKIFMNGELKSTLNSSSQSEASGDSVGRSSNEGEAKAPENQELRTSAALIINNLTEDKTLPPNSKLACSSTDTSSQSDMVTMSEAFPCDLNKNEKKNKIYLHGENHKDPADISIRDNMITKAGNGDFYLALEAYNYNDPEMALDFQKYHGISPIDTQIAGIEDELVHTVTMAGTNHIYLYRGINHLNRMQEYLAHTKMSFLLDFTSNKLKIKAWGRLKRPFIEQKQEELAKFIDNLISVRNSEPQWSDLLIKFQSSELWRNDLPFLEVSSTIALSIVETAKSECEATGKNLLPNLSPLYELLKDPSSILKETIFAEKIAVEWRNLSLAKHIAEIYCSALVKGKDLHVIVGGLHTQGLLDLLTKASQNKIEIEIVKK